MSNHITINCTPCHVLPGDVILCHLGESLTDDVLAILRDTLREQFPNNKVLVIEPGLRIEVKHES